jgi:N-acetylneuraminic acid mutarotase
MNQARLISIVLFGLLAFAHQASSANEVLAGQWQHGAPVPEARTEGTATTDGKRLYFLGGFIDGERDERGRPPVGRAVYAYDPEADLWAKLTDLPEGVHHTGLVHLDGRLYVIGGYARNTFDPTGAVRIFDIDSGRWSEGTPMPTPRGSIAIAVHEGRIHTIGGTVEDTDHVHEHDNPAAGDDRSVGTHEVYDPASDSWSRLAPMPTARNHHGAAMVDSRIHVFAGRVGQDFELTVHEIYDVKTDSWTTGPDLPTGRSGIAVAEHDGRIFVFGGETFSDPARTFDEAEVFDVATGLWQRLPPMPTARHGLGAAVINGVIHVVSGGPSPGYSYSDANEHFVPTE